MSDSLPPHPGIISKWVGIFCQTLNGPIRKKKILATGYWKLEMDLLDDDINFFKIGK